MSQAAQPLATTMVLRLDALEKENSVQASALNKVCEALTMLRDEVAAKLTANEGTASELCSKIESVCQTLEHLEVGRAQSRQPASGFARRMMDGMTGSNGKKW